MASKQVFSLRELLGTSLIMFLGGFVVAVLFSHVPISVWAWRWWEPLAVLGAVAAVVAVVWAHHGEGRRIADRERRDAVPIAAMIRQEMQFLRENLSRLRMLIDFGKTMGQVPSLDVLKAHRGNFVSKTLERTATEWGCFDEKVGDLLGLTLVASYRLEQRLSTLESDGNGLLAVPHARDAVAQVEAHCNWLEDCVVPLLSWLDRYLPQDHPP